ncbi:MAG TPA: hypothetical protein VD978_07800 [Azospirillum sp.]|nr:hypothetical protein [Azospirillum sp.]
MKRLTTASVLLMTALLTACGGGPGDGDLQDAVEAAVKADLQRVANTGKVFGALAGDRSIGESQFNPDAIRIRNLTAEDKRKIESGDYVVKVAFDAWNGALVQRSSARLTVTKVDGKWKVINFEKL